MKQNALVFLLFLLLTPFFADAQSFYAIRRERSLILTGGLSSSSYFGELKNDGELIDAKPAVTVGLQYYFTPIISARTELTYFTLKGSDADADDPGRTIRNLSFTSGNVEWNFVGMVNLFPMGRKFYQRPRFNLYGFAGIGLMYMNPKAEYEGKKYALQPLETEGVHYARVQPVIPYGLGVRVKAGPFFNVCVESGWRTTFTDYMDDISTVYPDRSTWTNPIRIALSDRRQELDSSLEPASAGSKRGNPDKNDSYYFLTLKIEYYLPSNFMAKHNQRRKLYNSKRKAYYR